MRLSQVPWVSYRLGKGKFNRKSGVIEKHGDL